MFKRQEVDVSDDSRVQSGEYDDDQTDNGEEWSQATNPDFCYEDKKIRIEE